MTEFEKWLATRPHDVQEVGRRYPIRTTVDVGGKVAHVVGYAENAGEPVGLLLSFVDPAADYDGAVESRFQVCGCCLQARHSVANNEGE